MNREDAMFDVECTIAYLAELNAEVVELQELAEAFPEMAITQRQLAARTATRDYYRNHLQEML